MVTLLVITYKYDHGCEIVVIRYRRVNARTHFVSKNKSVILLRLDFPSSVLDTQKYFGPHQGIAHLLVTNVHQVILLTTGGLKASKFCISKAIW